MARRQVKKKNARAKRQRRSARGHERLREVGQFLRDYTAGLNVREVRRLFDRDASQAYSVLTRDHAGLPEPKKRLRRLIFRARLVFLGLSYKLTPARRLLFAAALVGMVVGMLGAKFDWVSGKQRFTVDFSPFWFCFSFACLAFLLALELVDRVRVRDEMEVARELQAELLPNRLPELAGYRFAHSYRTANEVGGDFYDVTLLPDGRVALLVGDASGHGMAAGLVMAIANATLKTALDLDPAPERVIAMLNRTLCRTGTRRTFMSVFYALLDPASGRLDFICAGHPFPVLRRADGEVIEVGTGSLPLGIREPLAAAAAARTVTLGRGDLLLLFTDGLPEAVGPSGEAFGYPHIAALARAGGAPQAVHDRVLESFAAHIGEEPLLDDLTLLVIARQAAG
jgi:sigma-B regulation protein RsbU (phosphoserine phosphatase)